MRISVKMQVQPAIRGVAKLAKQIPYAASIALNRTGEEANAAIRQQMLREFTVRDRNLLRYVAPQQIPAPDRATKDRLSVLLQTEGKGRILNPYETGMRHDQRAPDEPVAVPTRDLRFTRQTVIPRRWYPANLGLVAKKGPTGSYFALGRGAIKNKATPFHTTARGAVQTKGKLRTFVLDPKQNRGLSPEQWGVYVRIGPKREDIRLIWQYRASVPRPRILHFEATARRVFADRYRANWNGAIALALRTAK